MTRPNRATDVVWNGDASTIFSTLITEPDVLHGATLLEAVGVIEEIRIGPVHFQDVYRSLLGCLRTMGYKDNDTLFLFPYNWRQSVVQTARQLVQFIDQRLGNGPPVVLIGHSLGSLVAREAVMLRTDPKAINDKISMVIELAPPHLGSSFWALAYAIELLGFNFLRRVLRVFAPHYVRAIEGLFVALVRSMPSVWELCPVSTELVLESSPGNARSSFEWPGWTQAVQIMARSAAEELEKRAEEVTKNWPKNVRVCVVHSRSYLTPYSFRFDTGAPFTIEANSPLMVSGDDTVWEWSALLHGDVRHEVDYPHRTIAADPKTLTVIRQEL